jgi:hypothetical protein
MATKTLNYNLTLPEDNEPADQNVFNENFEIIDGVLKELDTTKQAALSASQLEATNSGITNVELVDLVDNGAKNLIKNTAVSTSIFTVNSDGTVLVNGSSGTSNKVLDLEVKERSYPYDTVLSGCPSGGGYVNRYSIYLADANGSLVTLSATTGAADEGDTILIPANTTFKYVRILVRANQTINNLIFKPMLCSKTAWDISQEYVPYSPSNAELYEMIKALQSGTTNSSLQSTAQLTSLKDIAIESIDEVQEPTETDNAFDI